MVNRQFTSHQTPATSSGRRPGSQRSREPPPPGPLDEDHALDPSLRGIEWEAIKAIYYDPDTSDVIRAVVNGAGDKEVADAKGVAEVAEVAVAGLAEKPQSAVKRGRPKGSVSKKGSLIGETKPRKEKYKTNTCA